MKPKSSARLLGASLLVALALGSAANAAFITGGISFTGAYTPQNASGVAVSDLNLAKKIAFGATTVGSGSGTFAAIPGGTSVSMFSPLVFSPPTLPGSNLWSVTNAGIVYSFLLTSMINGGVTGTYPAVQGLSLSGTGTLSATGFQATPGTWIGTFNSGGGTFTWSSSTASSPVPDGGTTMSLLGLSLLGLYTARRKFSKH